MAVSEKLFDANRIFHIKGQPLRALSRVDFWKYLGIDFSPEGRRPVRQDVARLREAMDVPAERYLNRLLPRPRFKRRAMDSLPTMASPAPRTAFSD